MACVKSAFNKLELELALNKLIMIKIFNNNNWNLILWLDCIWLP